MSTHKRIRIVILTACVLLMGSAASSQEERLCSRTDNGRLTPAFMRTVVIPNDGETQTVFSGDRFSFRETIKHILGTAAGAPPGSDKWKLATSENEQISLLASLVRSFHQIERTNNGVRNDASPRPNEAEVQASQLLANMQPVGLFNRLDLAPASWRYCGEHRVVYAMGTGENRMFIIFEAALDNPDSTHSAAGCLRIASFWAGLKNKQPGELPDLLHDFYYEGDLGDGNPKVSSVLDSKHFGVPFGQIRGNLFMTKGDIPGNPWMLREWRTFPDANAGTRIVVDTVKSNPSPEFYSDQALVPHEGRGQPFADLRPEFKSRFVVANLRELIEVDLQAATQNRVPTGDEIFNKLSANFDDRFNDFESISQLPGDKLNASNDLKKEIENELKKYKLPANWALTPDHIIARAEALSCGGCHNLTKEAVGPGDASMKWPAALQFTHINESAQLSPALLDHFLPARCENLHKFMAEPVLVAEQSFSLDTGDLQSEIRDAVTRIEQTTEEGTVKDILPKLADDIAKIRAEDAEALGAFRPFRRTH
ncbi:hypothetical protein GOA97_06205 [Sinorhizobium meliloti]|nr:hypothetical protein [Sinorhizobium meliloti]MDW9654094.1 hypothetical protein [Sinorhizobium meliloti]MDW9914508.1 hypothetical protein [Sinorhizobium meliloti]MDW9937974.1 hypothetical protein [Sinorhizobium meliloti]MDW9945701.1 hypothetical protein [Sinorhizobium meliloti]